jgi:hypothetical protein
MAMTITVGMRMLYDDEDESWDNFHTLELGGARQIYATGDKVGGILLMNHLA